VLVIMDRNAMKLLTESNFEVKSEVRATAGEDSAGREGRISKPKPPFLICDDRKGLFAGADVKAGAISPDVDANRVYYGQLLSMNDILFEKKVAATAAAQNLAAKLTEQARMVEK
jgi:lipid-binding SYLF domain-containing protein